jgi:chromosome segregation ATPase
LLHSASRSDVWSTISELSDRALETAKGLRSLLQDILAPSVGRLDAKVEALTDRCERLADEIKENRNAHQALLAYLSDQLASLGNRIGKLEGRAEGLKAELVAVLQMETDGDPESFSEILIFPGA